MLFKLDIDQGMYWLFDIEEGSYFDLNEVSHFELSLFDGKTSFTEICEKVISKYNGEDLEVITKDLKELVDKLHQKDMVECKTEACIPKKKKEKNVTSKST